VAEGDLKLHNKTQRETGVKVEAEKKRTLYQHKLPERFRRALVGLLAQMKTNKQSLPTTAVTMNAYISAIILESDRQSQRK
jgi:hypothetical protein